ncbi:hypothetical protein K0C01_06010 [Salinarchaeum sp. IM2453]|uniref:hypothetical protein n=1 Tax=Salinarchaeum sp. IM2453 TaxID=2862870 RepID=UPI001C83F4C4|nr:hypothetical protein [Salinarchaeum sp. IM2453]QZA89673.1 hypothetical protein K0C01_06010 [Salinarchaeum sp. IM2453]
MESKGDPRVHFIINVIGSAIIGYIALWGMDFIDMLEFTLTRYVLVVIILVALTSVIVR